MYLNMHQTSPVISGSSVSLGGLQYFVLIWKERHNVSQDGAEAMLKFMRQMLQRLPQHQVWVPASWHLLCTSTNPEGKMATYQDYYYHACLRDGCVGHAWFKVLPRSEWAQHADDNCPHCQGPRFEKTELSGMVS